MTGAISFEQIDVGQRWHSEGRTLTEAELAMSCMLTTDWHPIHADEEFAKTTPIGRRMFHGTFGIAIAFGMATRYPELGDSVIAATGLTAWKYLAPLFVGDTVHVEVEIIGKRVTSDGKRGVIERRLRLLKHTGEVAQEGVAGTLVRIKAPAGTGDRTVRP